MGQDKKKKHYPPLFCLLTELESPCQTLHVQKNQALSSSVLLLRGKYPSPQFGVVHLVISRYSPTPPNHKIKKVKQKERQNKQNFHDGQLSVYYHKK